ncbi:hypothetical protein ACQKWADRAFT_305395 [Trichoderma austrokoningii]
MRVMATMSRFLEMDFGQWHVKSWYHHTMTPRHGFYGFKATQGKRKTMLLCYIINKLENRPSTKLCYFFCQAMDICINNETAVLRGLS